MNFVFQHPTSGCVYIVMFISKPVRIPDSYIYLSGNYSQVSNEICTISSWRKIYELTTFSRGGSRGGGRRGCALHWDEAFFVFAFEICLPHQSVTPCLGGAPPPKNALVRLAKKLARGRKSLAKAVMRLSGVALGRGARNEYRTFRGGR